MPSPRRIAIVGAGYVGLPLAHVFAGSGAQVTLVDVNEQVVAGINQGVSHIEDVPSLALKELVDQGLVAATTDYDLISRAEAILIALPTPCTKQREPDLGIVLSAVREIALRLQAGQLVVLESTTYPGTTRDEVLPILEAGSGLRVGTDFFLAFSPERVDPGRADWTTRTTPKVMGGITQSCTARCAALYSSALETVVPVSTPETAELTKLLENIFRSVNIALVNELAQMCERMNIDVWEVLDAAATKPFGFMSFKPGPGLGGHCLPIDPFYLTWKAREFKFYTEFIELAGKVNENQPAYCVRRIGKALNQQGKALRDANVMLLGVAYKANVSDLRESPALEMIEFLQAEGATVSYHDPHVPALAQFGLRSVPLEEGVAQADVVAIVTQHAAVDHAHLIAEAKLVVDFRDATGAAGARAGNVIKL